jgi:2-C-methyl-D-erythritol 4-phosphate cytidylyltransferase
MKNFANVGVVLPAGGVGSRLGASTPKQLLKIGSEPIFFYSVKAFQKALPEAKIIIVCAEELISVYQKFLAGIDVSFVAAGKERYQSVANGINALSDNIKHVLIHDVARPFVSKTIILETLNTLKLKGSCIVAKSVTDTVKIVTDGIIRDTPNREEVYLAQTPQAFSKKTLQNAYKEIDFLDFTPTDEASMLESLGEKIHIVEGDFYNSKITLASDLDLFRKIFSESFLKDRQG